MMARIACISLQYNQNDVCGTLISNGAFQQWCYIFGHQADQVGFTGLGRPLKHWIAPGAGRLKAFRQVDCYDVINDYDGAYFSTAGIRPSSKKPPVFMKFKHLNVPFIVGVHDEDDYRAYEPNLQAMAGHPKFRGLVVNGMEALSLPIKARKVHWFPCTLPAYLLKESTMWQDRPEGLLYAGRLITWRLLPALAQLTKSDAFMNEVQSQVEIRGVAPGIGGHALEEKLKTMRPRWSRVEGYFNVYDVKQMQAMYDRRRFFWEVGRVDPGKHYYRRFNLVAVEAIGQGCIPIVSPEFAPAWTHEFSILFDHRNWTEQDIVSQLRAVNDNYDVHRERMRDIVLNSHWSYENVKIQFRKLLAALFV
jgi:hypothetical protein